jgi:tetratricopeptide (TPR) repeat protein
MGLFRTDEEKKQELLKKGLDFENKNENDKAVREFEKMLQLDPNDQDALFNLGFIYSYMRMYPQAYEYFKKLVNINPKHIESFNNLGLLFARQGKYTDALLVFNKGIEYNPDVAILYNNRGNVLYDLGRFENALKDFQKAGGLDPIFTEKLYHLGIDSYVPESETDNAIKKLEDAAKNNLNKSKVFHDLGIAYLERHIYDKAINAFNQALAIDPNYLSAYLNMGYAYQHKKDFPMAIRAFEKALILDPKSAKLFNTIGLLFDKMEKPDIAVKAYKKAVQLDPTYANSHYMLAQLYRNRGIIDKAVAEYIKHIRIQEQGPLVEDALLKIAEIKNLSLKQVKDLFSAFTNPLRGRNIDVQKQYDSLKKPAPVPFRAAESPEINIIQENNAYPKAVSLHETPDGENSGLEIKAIGSNDSRIIELPELGVVENNNIFESKFEPEFQLVSLDSNNPSGTSVSFDYSQMSPEAMRETIIKAVGSNQPLTTDSMPEFSLEAAKRGTMSKTSQETQTIPIPKIPKQ